MEKDNNDKKDSARGKPQREIPPSNEGEPVNDAKPGSGIIDSVDEDLSALLKKKCKIRGEERPGLTELSLPAVAKYLQRDGCKNVIIMVGAGISTAAGIPDFRTPGTGIYSSLDKYNLPSPDCMFDIQYFKMDPEPFFQFAKGMFPSYLKPTLCHYFCRLLNEKGKLLRLYTQNIDSLERISGLSPEKIVESHGTFYTSHCMNPRCRASYDIKWARERILKDQIPRCSHCRAVVKPDITFFGEMLPERFHSLSKQDFRACDLLIVIGTSLTVQPFATLIDAVPHWIPRLLINNQKCGKGNTYAKVMGVRSGFDFDSMTNQRDVFWQGLADDGCKALAEALGWEEELLSMFRSEHAKLDQLFKSDPVFPDTFKGHGKGPS